MPIVVRYSAVPCPLCHPPPEQVVFENDDALVLLHDDWAVRGHLMIVAKRHVQNVSDLDAEEWTRVADVWHRTERALLALSGVERAIAMKLGIQTPHLHVHLYPFAASATRDDVFAAIDGTTRSAPEGDFVAALAARLNAPRKE